LKVNKNEIELVVDEAFRKGLDLRVSQYVSSDGSQRDLFLRFMPFCYRTLRMATRRVLQQRANTEDVASQAWVQSAREALTTIGWSAERFEMAADALVAKLIGFEQRYGSGAPRTTDLIPPSTQLQGFMHSVKNPDTVVLEGIRGWSETVKFPSKPEPDYATLERFLPGGEYVPRINLAEGKFSAILLTNVPFRPLPDLAD
jgi:hypothetical protein